MSNILIQDRTKYLDLIATCEENIKLVKIFDEVTYSNILMGRYKASKGFFGLFKKEQMTFEEAYNLVLTEFDDFFMFSTKPKIEKCNRLNRLNMIKKLFTYAESEDLVQLSKEDLSFIDKWSNSNLEIPENFDEYKKMKGQL